MATQYEQSNVSLAKKIINGQEADLKSMQQLAQELIKERSFGFARRILARARRKPEANHDPARRLKLAQMHALATYKDIDLLAEERFADALNILSEADELAQTKNQETLGLVGSLHKRLWELDGQKQHLERALAYYLRGYKQGVATDYGYTGINAAFMLDLLAQQEEQEARAAMMRSENAAVRRQDARRIREEIVAILGDSAAKDAQIRKQWWFLVTLAEACFGLRNYTEAAQWLAEAAEIAKTPGAVPKWERESTARQLAQLARLQTRGAESVNEHKGGAAWEVLNEFLEQILGNTYAAWAACEAAFTGRIGLALSGGGFRAALYHIGVLAKLAEWDVLRKIEVLSCVSGGSIIGAHYYLEVRKLLQEKADGEATRADFIEIVKRIEKDFLDGVQTNIRTSVIAEWWTNVKMLFWPNYSRTLRVGELYEENIFARVKDGAGAQPRWLNELKIMPKGEDSDFHPKNDNWRREAKVPILVLNATALNTGHNWQFTASWMGEPPAAIDAEVDGNYRLRRLYYDQAPAAYRKMRLGHAVAASSCVPGIFEPLVLDGLYPDVTVRLVDGGVYDNQGTASLLDQDCNILLVSDASGQMSSENDPGNGLLRVPLRTNDILQARIRVAQYREMAAQRRAAALRGLMFIHLKKDLRVRPLDWINCDDPQDESENDDKLTGYGVSKLVQERLAAIRTDLDSFSDAEAYSLMLSGYRMTEFELPRSMPDLLKEDATREDWRFLKFENEATSTSSPQTYLQILHVAASLAFKVWQLSRGLLVASVLLGLLLLGALGYFIWLRRGETLFTLTWGAAALMLASVLVLCALPAALRRIIDYRKTLEEAAIGLSMSIVGWAVARLHLHVFDKWYLRLGSLKRLR